MTAPHFSISASTNFLCSAPSTRRSVMTTALSPSCFLMKSGSFSATFRASLSFFCTSAGVALGAVGGVQDAQLKVFEASLGQRGQVLEGRDGQAPAGGHGVGFDLLGFDLAQGVGGLVAQQVDL